MSEYTYGKFKIQRSRIITDCTHMYKELQNSAVLGARVTGDNWRDYPTEYRQY